ncbi:MAG: GNAT family N-acetyltransferase [Phycisphaerales bacterium JB039]
MPGVELRPVAPADLPVFFEHQRDPVACRMAAFTARDPDDRDAFDAHWQRILADDTVTVRTILADGAVAGHIASFLREGDLEGAYWIDRAMWGRGIATAALRAFLDIVTTRPIHARAAADNAASLRVLERCGFQPFARDRGFASARGEEIEEVILILR